MRYTWVVAGMANTMTWQRRGSDIGEFDSGGGRGKKQDWALQIDECFVQTGSRTLCLPFNLVRRRSQEQRQAGEIESTGGPRVAAKQTGSSKFEWARGG